MRMANNECKFRGLSKLLDFRNADVADVAGVTDEVLQVVQEVEEVMTIDINDSKVATEENVSPTPPEQSHLLVFYSICHFPMKCK
jgi:hypothetical protein